MATLIENKNRIVSAFNAIRESILAKGEVVTSSVESYANAISLIGDSSYICDKTIERAGGVCAKSGVPFTVTCEHTFGFNANVIVQMVTFGYTYNESSYPDECKIYIDGVEVPATPVKFDTSFPYAASKYVHCAHRIGLTKVNVKKGSTLRAEYTVNNCGSGSDASYGSNFYSYIFFHYCFDGTEPDIVKIYWDSPLATKGTFINSLTPDATTSTNYGGKQIVYNDALTGQLAVANPYQAGEIFVPNKYASLRLNTYAGPSTTKDSACLWYYAGVVCSDPQHGDHANNGGLMQNWRQLITFEQIKPLGLVKDGNINKLKLTTFAETYDDEIAGWHVQPQSEDDI